MTNNILSFALALCVTGVLATQAHATERTWSIQETIRRAQIGTHSPRLAPPVRVAPARTPAAPDRYERMECRPDPSRPLNRVLICEPRR